MKRSGRWLEDIAAFILEVIALEFAIPLLGIGYCTACFVVFDAFHISDLGAQVFIGVSPFIILAIWLVSRGKIK